MAAWCHGRCIVPCCSIVVDPQHRDPIAALHASANLELCILSGWHFCVKQAWSHSPWPPGAAAPAKRPWPPGALWSWLARCIGAWRWALRVLLAGGWAAVGMLQADCTCLQLLLSISSTCSRPSYTLPCSPSYLAGLHGQAGLQWLPAQHTVPCSLCTGELQPPLADAAAAQPGHPTLYRFALNLKESA